MRWASLALLVCALASCDRPKSSSAPLPSDDDDPTDEPATTKSAATKDCDQTLCGPSCVDLDSDPAHCGKCDVACGEGESCAGGICAQPTNWEASAVPHRCSVGRRFGYLCPRDGALGPVFGTDDYTDDSSICSAAVHAGKIDAVNGGAVAIEVHAPHASYLASERNDVKSRAWDTEQCGFTFVGGACSADTTKCGDTCADLKTDRAHCGACDHACDAGESCVAGACSQGTSITWSTTSSDLRCPRPGEFAGASATYQCPASPDRFTVYGTDVYTNDSSICTAAVHAGKLGSGGGVVTIETRPGLGSYKSSTRYGVKSTAYGAWKCSFVFK